MAKIRAVTSGKIWANRGAREVLYAVLKYKQVENGVLRISAPKQNLEGDIYISRAIFVNGARLKMKNDRGWPVIKRLLSVSDGAFQYLDYADNDVGDIDQDLKIRLTDLINLLPDLPDDVALVMGRNTINKIRAMDLTSPQTEEEALINQDTLAQLAKWERDSMRLRAAAFWGLFVVVSSVAAAIYYFQR